jgi:quinoprotein glucose dehydrogenase
MRREWIIGALLLCSGSSFLGGVSDTSGRDWPVYGGDSGNQHFSPLKSINLENVKRLREAWRYDAKQEGGLETSPLIIDGKLYGITPAQQVFALDAATGRELWRFGSRIDGGQPNRGLSYWSDSRGDQRIFVGIKYFLYALNATTGQPIQSFGEDGRIDLRKGLRGDFERQALVCTSPGAIFKDLIIVGMREPETLPAPPGDIRAFDVRTGQIRWTFHTIPHPGEYGYETWPPNSWRTSGAANNWAGMAVDSSRGIVYVPTGSAAADFYGADRVGDDLFANSLLALNAETGERIWHFQIVKHDIWDRDLPSPPTLVTVRIDGQSVDAVAQTTKSGYVFLFRRDDGKPVFPIEYRSVSPSDVPGEVASGEQPFPLAPPPFARQELRVEMLTRRTSAAHEAAVKAFRQMRSEGPFVPFSVGRSTVVFPGFDGGAEWGGSAVDPRTGVLYVNANDVPWTGTLVRTSPDGQSLGQSTYGTHCSVCHGDTLTGSPPQFPSLVDLPKHRRRSEIENIVENGKGRMPAFSSLPFDNLAAVIDFVWMGGKDSQTLPREANESASDGSVTSPAYRFGGYKKFLDPDGYPAVEPPWGTLTAIDLASGKHLWKVPLGDYPELAAKGMKDTGTENYGGPVLTAGGLLFIAATNFDNKLRALNAKTGELLWESVLPFPGNATPAIYQADGREYVVVAAGGGRVVGQPSGGVYIAFALPPDTK